MFIKFKKMLSIIISSYQPNFYSVIEENIEQTCGVVYEIIKISNPGLMGICEAYNKGAMNAKYDYLLFLHEDVEFTAGCWGSILINHLKKIDVGLIGLAGCSYVPNVPFSWWDKPDISFRNIQQFNGSKEVKNYNLEKDQCIAAVDGVFMGCRKDVYEKFKFDNSITGFHSYDLDFSVRVASEFRNKICSEIKLKHFSEGKPDKNWFSSIIKNRIKFKAPPMQILNKKTELFFFEKLDERLSLFGISNRKKILLRYNNPFFIGYKVALINLKNLLLK